MAYQFLLNRNSVEENVPTGELLLDIIRQNRGLTGTKEACREGDCGACQILVGELIVAIQSPLFEKEGLGEIF